MRAARGHGIEPAAGGSKLTTLRPRRRHQLRRGVEDGRQRATAHRGLACRRAGSNRQSELPVQPRCYCLVVVRIKPVARPARNRLMGLDPRLLHLTSYASRCGRPKVLRWGPQTGFRALVDAL